MYLFWRIFYSFYILCCLLLLNYYLILFVVYSGSDVCLSFLIYLCLYVSYSMSLTFHLSVLLFPDF